MKTMMKMVGVVAIGLLVAGNASALPLQLKSGNSSTGYGPYQTGQGGEFTLTVVQGTLGLSGYSTDVINKTRGFGYNENSFQTFCIEDGSPAEYIWPNDTMDAIQSTSASWGSNYPDGDPVSQGTGWLYSQFAKGILADYDYSGSGRHDSAGKLQQAIWLLEGEDGGAANIFTEAVSDAFKGNGNRTYGLAQAKEDGGWKYGVFALNLTVNDVHRQDQLYYDGHRVPDGGITLALLGFAMVGLAGLRRRLS